MLREQVSHERFELAAARQKAKGKLEMRSTEASFVVDTVDGSSTIGVGGTIGAAAAGGGAGGGIGAAVEEEPSEFWELPKGTSELPGVGRFRAAREGCIESASRALVRPGRSREATCSSSISLPPSRSSLRARCRRAFATRRGSTCPATAAAFFA